MVTKKYCDRCGKETFSLISIPISTLTWEDNLKHFSYKEIEELAKRFGGFSCIKELCSGCYAEVIELILNKQLGTTNDK
jgi:hypothetical protein